MTEEFSGPARFAKPVTRGTKLFARLFVIGFIVLCLFCAGCPWWSDFTYSEGDRVGVIVKFSHKGVIWKSWEGEMQLGGVKAAKDGAVPNVWEFSLRRGEEKDLVQKLSQAQDSGKRIKVRYRQAMLGLPWRGGTSYYLESLEVLEP